MSKKDKPSLIEIPCPRAGCGFTGIIQPDVFLDDDPDARKYRLRWIRNVINQLTSEHERGKHIKHCDEVITAVCHCRCCHCGGTS